MISDGLNIQDWGNEFGALPIPLRNVEEEQYLLQTGTLYDTCFRILGSADRNDYFSSAWSTGVLNYMHMFDDKLYVYNWASQRVRAFDIKRIEDDFPSFLQHLSLYTDYSDNGVQEFVLALFRQMRNLTYKDDSSENAINLLYRLLISLEGDDYTNIDENKWKIPSITVPYFFERFVEQINSGVGDIKPNLDLILRHCAGPIFEAAHQEVLYFNPDRDLFGGVSSKISIGKIPYASMHYTPTYLARSIVENVLRSVDIESPSISIIDPACGSGVFLVEILKQLKIKQYKGKVVINAFDKSNVAIQSAIFLLEYEKRTQWTPSQVELNIKCVDSLVEEWGQHDIVVMNPPFLAWDLMSKDERDLVENILSPIIKRNKANIASAFLYKAICALKDNGVLGVIVPTSILTAEFYSPIRNQIKEEYNITQVASLGSYVFGNAIADTSFIVAAKNALREIPVNIWCKNIKNVAPDALAELRKMQAENLPRVVTSKYSIYKPISFPIFNGNWRLVSAFEEKFIYELSKYLEAGKLCVMKDIFKIFQGVITGKKDVFELSSDKYQKLSNCEKKYFRQLVNHDSLKAGTYSKDNYLWYPYDANGLTIRKEEEALSINFVRENLLPYKAELQKRYGDKYWWELTSPRKPLYEKKARMYSSRFGDNRLFALDIEGECVIEEGNGYILKSNKTEDFYFYLAVIHSGIFNVLLSIYSKHIMAGYDLSPKQVENIPIPDITLIREEPLCARLIEIGKLISNGSWIDMMELNNIVSSFYPFIKI